jgi:hypothetical protein
MYIFSTDIDFVNNITITLSNKEMTHNKKFHIFKKLCS